MLTKRITTYRSIEPASRRPWFAIGPVFGDKGKVSGAVLSLGAWNLALHTAVKPIATGTVHFVGDLAMPDLDRLMRGSEAKRMRSW